MNENEIFEKLKSFIIDIKEENIEITKSTALIESNLLDSLELINYLTQIEETFGVNITVDTLIDKKLGIIENMIKYIQANS
jgi:acyl carrier protein